MVLSYYSKLCDMVIMLNPGTPRIKVTPDKVTESGGTVAPLEMHSPWLPLPYACLWCQAVPSLLIGTQEISGRRNNKVMVSLPSMFISPFPLEFAVMGQVQTFGLPRVHSELSLSEPHVNSLWILALALETLSPC